MSKTFEHILEMAKADQRIVGLVLVGSRGKKFTTEYSDYDVNLIVVPEAKEAIEKEMQDLENIDLVVYTLPEFGIYAAWGSPEGWDRYDFAHAQVLVDKTDDKIESIVREKATLPDFVKHEVVTHAIIDLRQSN